MPRPQEPYQYEWREYINADHVVQSYFGSEATMLKPSDPRVGANHPAITMRHQIDRLADSFGATYTDFGRVALTRLIQSVYKPTELESGDYVLGTKGARVSIPMAVIETDRGSIDRTLTIDAIEAIAFVAGGTYDFARRADGSRIYYPMAANISVVNAAEGHTPQSQMVAYFNQQNVSFSGGTGFIGGEARRSTWEDYDSYSVLTTNGLGEAHPGYEYVSGLILEAYRAVDDDYVDINIAEGDTDTFMQFSARLDQRTAGDNIR